MKNARPKEASETITMFLKDISKSCHACQRLGTTPHPFKTALPIPSEVKLGEQLSIDLMCVKGKAIPLIEITAMRLGSATFLDSQNQKYGQRVDVIWIALLYS